MLVVSKTEGRFDFLNLKESSVFEIQDFLRESDPWVSPFEDVDVVVEDGVVEEDEDEKNDFFFLGLP